MRQFLKYKNLSNSKATDLQWPLSFGDINIVSFCYHLAKIEKPPLCKAMARIKDSVT